MCCLCQALVRGAIDDISQRTEARPVAGTVPGLLAAVPVHDTAQVGADRGQSVQLTRRVPVEGELLEAFAYYRAFTSLDVGDLINLAGRRKVGVVCGDLEVFACEGANGLQRLTRRIVEAGPWIGTTFDGVSGIRRPAMVP